MKKLGKLQINSERIMTNEELIILRGGDEDWCCYCTGPGYWGVMASSSEDDCEDSCAQVNSTYVYHC